MKSTEGRPAKQASHERREKKKTKYPWQAKKGWTTVEVGDGLLVGSTEGGFQGLEEFALPAGSVWDDSRRVQENSEQLPDTHTAAEESKAGKNKTNETSLEGELKVTDTRDAAAGSSPTEDLDRIKAELAEVEAENLRLKKQYSRLLEAKSNSQRGQQGSKQAVVAADAHQEQRLNHKERKKLKRKAYLAAKREESRKQKNKQTAGSSLGTGSPDAGEVDHDDDLVQEVAEVAPKADMSAWKPFQLEDRILAALDSQGFRTPTPIQEECLLAAIRDHRDVIGAAQTGSGKTLAFGLPIVQALLAERQNDRLAADGNNDSAATERLLRALILAPTRELALQVSAHIQAVAKPCNIWCVPIVGGIAQVKQERLLETRPEIVVATPGRLWEVMREGHQHLTNFSRLSFLVLDEADRMVQQGHFEELSSILDFVPRPGKRGGIASKRDSGPSSSNLQHSKRGPPEEGTETASEEESERAAEEGPARSTSGRKLQTFVFSATLTMPATLRRRLRRGGGGAAGSASLEHLMDKIPFRDKPKVADLTSQRRLADRVQEAYLESSEEDRDVRLYYMLAQHPGRTLVFANAISTVRRLAAILRLLQLPAVALHASMQQRQRLKALDRFRQSEAAVLIATDVAARGLDIQGVSCVIHYQIPAAVDVYVHRCGRTARASAEGVSVALVTPKESSRFAALLKALGRDYPPLFPLDPNLLPGALKRIRLATRLDEKVRLRSKRSAHKSWQTRAAEAAGIDLSGSETETDEALVIDDSQPLQEELARLLQEPLQPRYSQRYFAGAPSAALPAGADFEEAQHQEQPNSSVAEAVTHATRLKDARKAAAAEEQKAAKRKKARRKGSRQRQLALNAAIDKRQSSKQGARGSRFVVIPGAFGRETQGPNALEALKSKI